MKHYVLLLHADPPTAEVRPHDGRIVDYRTLVEGIGGGLIERVSAKRGGLKVDCWVDDSGLLKGLPHNVLAQSFAAYSHGPLVGDAIVTGEEMGPEGGESVAFTADEMLRVLAGWAGIPITEGPVGAEEVAP